jgi:hypothetical protein
MRPAEFFRLGLLGLVLLGPLSPHAQVPSTETARFSIAIQNRKADPKTIRATRGQVIELAFTADEAIELHIHGYDQLITVQPGSAAVMRLEARVAGRFAIEAHRFGSNAGRRHAVLLYLEVHPR